MTPSLRGAIQGVHPNLRIDNLGRREATTVAAGVVQRVFASVGSAPPIRRVALNLANLDLASDLYVCFARTGASAPSITSTDCDLAIPPRSSRQFLLGPSVEAWVRTASASAAPYSALELL